MSRYFVARCFYTSGSGDHYANTCVAKSIFMGGERADELRRSSYITTGLPVLVPVGLVMRIFGPTYAAPRLAMLFFNLAGLFSALLALGKLGRTGQFTGLSFVFISLPFIVTRGMGEPLLDNVVGEIPAFFFALIGFTYVPFLRDGERNAFRAGLFLTLSALTKLIGILFIPPVTLFLAWSAFRNRDAVARLALRHFGIGILTAAGGLSVLRVVISGSVSATIRYVKRFFFGWVIATSGLSNGTKLVTGHALEMDLHKFRMLMLFCANVPLFLAIASIAAISIFDRSSEADPERHREALFGYVLLFSSVGPILFWLFFDPFSFLRRVVPAILLAVAGLSAMVANSRRPVWKLSFLSLLALAGISHLWGFRKEFHVPTHLTDVMAELFEVRGEVEELINRKEVASLRGCQWYILPTLESSGENFPARIVDFRSYHTRSWMWMKDNQDRDVAPQTQCEDPSILFSGKIFTLGTCGSEVPAVRT